MRKYQVTCLSCKQSDVITIDEANHNVWDFGKKMLTNFLSARWRSDLQWGFECKCGNDNRLALEEKGQFNTLVSGDPKSIKRIADSLKIKDDTQFKMEATK